MPDHRNTETWLPDWAIPWVAVAYLFVLYSIGLAVLAIGAGMLDYLLQT